MLGQINQTQRDKEHMVSHAGSEAVELRAGAGGGKVGRCRAQGTHFSYWMSKSRDRMYSMVTAVNNTVLCT